MGDTDVLEAIEDLIDEKPDFSGPLQEILAIDAEAESWDFSDISLDSGRFGELVSRGIVSKRADGGYALRDPAATSRAIGDHRGAGTTQAHRIRINRALGASFERYLSGLRSIDPAYVVGIVASMAILVSLRSVNYSAVHRSEATMLPGNDPYHYRYWVDRLLENSNGPLDFSYVSDLPNRAAVGEPLTYTTGWWVSEVLGGGAEAAAFVVTWLPLVCAIIVGSFVFGLATTLTGDRRIGLASIVMFALIPAHAVYSGIGFFDHHTFDYVWLALTALCLASLAVDVERSMVTGGDAVAAHLRRPKTWLISAILGVAITAQVFYWNGSPLLLWALAFYIGLRAISDLRAKHSSFAVNLPIIGALAFASVASHTLHTSWGWQEPMVVYTPAMVLFGAVTVFLFAEIVARSGLPVWIQVIGESIALVSIVGGLRLFRPDYFARLQVRGDALFGREGIAETRPLFTADLGFVLGPIDHFGLIFYVAMPILLLSIYLAVQTHRPSWLVLGAYGWYLLGLTVVQLRFAGELSAFLAVAAGIGFVHLLSTIDIARRPQYGLEARFSNGEPHDQLGFPTRTGVVYGFVLFLLVASLSLVMIWSLSGFLAIDDDQYETAMWIAADTDSDRPDFVLSEWSWNRMYNYHVTGDSDGYGYASSHYQPFITTTDPDGMYRDRFANNVGYIVLADHDISPPEQSAYTRLWDHYGSATDSVDGVAHYRAVYVADSGTIKVFEVVPGAVIRGSGVPNETVSASTMARIPNDEFPYERRATVNETGDYAIIVAHPGEYSIETDTVTITEADVRGGNTIDVS